MRFLDFRWTLVSSSIALAAAACGGSDETTATGGAAGGTTTSSTTTTSSSTTVSTVTTSSSTGTGGDKGMPSDDYPAPHADPPEVVTYGGPVLASPRIVPVFFANEDPATVAALEDFAQKIGSTTYWTATTAEYGVGPATAGPSVKLAEAAPATITDTSIQTWLRTKLNTEDPAFPAPDADTVYVLHYPPGTVVSAGGDKSCEGFGGYHSNIKLDAAHGGMPVAYAVIPYCGGFAGLDGVNALTAVTSHELIEAASDPYPMTDPAYGSTDDASFYWVLALGGGENADLCAQNDSSFVTFDELPYAVQRSWSNVSAKAGHDPCVPTFPGDVYFAAAPTLTDDVKVSFQGQSVVMKGVHVPVGETRTVEVRLFSDGDTGGPWDVEVDAAPFFFLGSGTIDVSLDRYSGQNGEKLYLTITVYEASPLDVEVFRITSYTNAAKHTWYGVIGN